MTVRNSNEMEKQLTVKGSKSSAHIDNFSIAMSTPMIPKETNF